MRNSVFSGVFYESSPAGLKKQIKSCFLSNFGPGALPEKNNHPLKGVIAPHAGYLYSGPCAAHSYGKIAESESPDLFIIIGPSHPGFKNCVSKKNLKTPLGIAEIDKPFVDALIKNGLRQDEPAHAQEHSIEVQIPFLQYVKKDFRFVPVLVSDDYSRTADIIRKTLKNSGKKAIIIASSDFTHYGASYRYVPFEKDVKKRMHKLDAGAIECIKKMDAGSFLDYVRSTGATICGNQAIASLISLVRSADAELLKYYTSADIAESDYSFAVGYAALKF